jgi:choline kinase
LKAIVYAAGRASRLGPRWADSHKALLAFGGRTLLEWHARHLSEIGVAELVVVTGHKADLVEAELARAAAFYPLSARAIYNPDFLAGSVLSMNASIPEIGDPDGPVLLMDADVLYPLEMLRRLARSDHRTALLVDREYSTADDDPVLVPIARGRPIDFMKRWVGDADEVGESIGFFKIDPADVGLLIERTAVRVEAGENEAPYEDVLRDMVLEGRFGHEDVTGLPWTEIDFPQDVERAEREVFPAIERLGDARR